jgi:DNA-binding MarR family transcriptional regulator
MKYSAFQNHEESIGLLFWQAATLWQRRIKEALQKFDLTHTQFVILAVIEELMEIGEPITQKNLSDFSLIDVMTVSSTVRLLEKKNLIQRLPHETDTRAKSLVNTKQGTTAVSQAIKEVERVDREYFSDDVQMNTQLRQLLSGLTKIRQ